MQATITNSLYGSPRQYVVGQGLLMGTNLHLQFKGEPGNRIYGLSHDVQFGGFGSLSAAETANSLTGSGKQYAVLQASPDGSNVKFQIKGVGGNRTNYHSFEVFDPYLSEWLAKQLKQAEQMNTKVEDVEIEEEEVQAEQDEIKTEIEEKLEQIVDLADDIRRLLAQ